MSIFNNLTPGSTALFTSNDKPIIDIRNSSINNILREVLPRDHADELISIISEMGLTPVSIDECKSYSNYANKCIIKFEQDDIIISLYMEYYTLSKILKYGMYTPEDLTGDAQYNMSGVYGRNHPSGYRFWGYDDESVYFQDDESDRELFMIQDEKELYDAVLALCIKYYHDNKERIELDKFRRLHG